MFAAVAEQSVATRIVSLNPSLTEIVLALGAADQLIGVDEYSARQQPQLVTLPRVGGLYNPSIEKLVALQPDLVLLVPSVEQRSFRESLTRLKIPVAEFDPYRFDEVLSSIRILGARIGRKKQAAERVKSIEAVRLRTQQQAPKRAIPAVLVLQRDPLFIVGGDNFIHEMMQMVGIHNVGVEFSQAYPRVSLEWLIAAKPKMILDASTNGKGIGTFWQRWPSIPAVANDGIFEIDAARITLPGPYLDRALIELQAVVEAASSKEVAKHETR